MTLVANKRTGCWEVDFKTKAAGRLHVSLGKGVTTKKEANRLHDAVGQLFDAADAYPDLVARLRARTLSPESIAACVKDQRSFDTLRVRQQWPTLREAADQYIAALASNDNVSAATVSDARQHLARVCGFVHDGRALGGVRVDEIPMEAADAYVTHVRASTTKANTAAVVVSRFGALYTWLAKREERAARQERRLPRVLACPIDPDTKPTAREHRERWLTEAEAAALLAETPAFLRFAVLCGLHAGLRVNEVTHLRPREDVDERAGVIRVQARPGWKPKRGKNRVVPMSTPLREAARLQREQHASREWMVTNARGGRMADTSLWDYFRVAVRAAGLVAGRAVPEGVVFHTLRHTFASHAIMRGTDVLTVARLLGDTVDTVVKTYAHLALDHKREAVERLAGLGFAVPPARPVPAPLADQPATRRTPEETPRATTRPLTNAPKGA